VCRKKSDTTRMRKRDRDKFAQWKRRDREFLGVVKGCKVRGVKKGANWKGRKTAGVQPSSIR